MTRLAVLVGIDHYANGPLKGCVKDVSRMQQVLSRHDDKSLNFECKTYVSSETTISRSLLRAKFEQLFAHHSDMVLFYFAGHGALNRHRGAIMVTQDTAAHDQGVPLNDLLGPLASSPAQEKVVIIDACYAGGFGEIPFLGEHSVLSDNVAVLAATRKTETAAENQEGGLFTTLIVSALEGGGADVRGTVTIADVYTYASTVLSGWQQRPLLKANISQLLALRRCKPAVSDDLLRRLPGLFPTAKSELKLNPSFEPTSEKAKSANVEIFGVLQTLRDAGLLVPSGGAKALYFAAMRSKTCTLTPLGRFYWQLSKAGRI